MLKFLEIFGNFWKFLKIPKKLILTNFWKFFGKCKFRKFPGNFPRDTFLCQNQLFRSWKWNAKNVNFVFFAKINFSQKCQNFVSKSTFSFGATRKKSVHIFVSQFCPGGTPRGPPLNFDILKTKSRVSAYTARVKFCENFCDNFFRNWQFLHIFCTPRFLW